MKELLFVSIKLCSFKYFFKVIDVLYYSGVLKFLTQGGICVPCPPLCALLVLPFYFDSYRVPVPALVVFSYVVDGLGWCEGVGRGGA